MTRRRAVRLAGLTVLVGTLGWGIAVGARHLLASHQLAAARATRQIAADRSSAGAARATTGIRRRPGRPSEVAAGAHHTTAQGGRSGPGATTAPAGGTAPVIGAYLGPGNVAGATVLSTRLPAGLPTVLDYLDGTSWASLTSASPAWLANQWRPTGERPTFLVPLLPNHGGSLAAGAAGAYDAEFAHLGEVLVAKGEADATLVLGWSPLEPGLPWSVGSPAGAAQYVSYFRKVVATMRAVPGAQFRFGFQPGPLPADPVVPPGSLYPGNASVDQVDVTIFDQVNGPARSGSRRWAIVEAKPGGPAWASHFAAAHDRPLVVDGLGLVPSAAGGGGDDPAFVRAFLDWAHRARVRTIYLWAEGSWAFDLQHDPAAFSLLQRVVARWDGDPVPANTTGRAAGSGGTRPS